jgi:hypothetical protein
MKKASKPRRKNVQETRTSYQVTSRTRRTAKPEITVPASVRDAAQQLAQQLGMSLSDLYTAALTAYLAEQREAKVSGSRRPGSAKDLIVMADDFDAPLGDFSDYQP